MKKLIALIHLWLSIPVGLVFTVVALSGSALVFETEITRALRPGIYRVDPPAGAQPLAPSQLAERIRAQVPDSLRLTSLRLPADLREPCMAGFAGGGKRRLSVDPCTGEAKGWTETPAFFRTMRQLHRWFLDPPIAKGAPSAGKSVVGIATLVSAVVLLTGLVLWVPRTRRALKSRLVISRTRGRHRFWYDLHVSAGFYASLLLLLMALTGLTWSFDWYRSTAYALFGGKTTTQQRSSGSARPAGTTDRDDRPSSDPAVWDLVFTELRGRYPAYQSITLNERTAQIATGSPNRMRRTDTATFDSAGNIVSLTPHSDTPRTQSLRGWFYALHTGTWGGAWSKTLYLLAALIGASLPITGYYLWIKRAISRHRARRSTPVRR